ncbi:MAG: hypothetical protein R3344_13135 [Acidobacteriota bacterium]|nr:hypothetical protein [Acidobacteriota bacterium]
MTGPNITSTPAGHNGALPTRVPRRDEIAGATVEVMLKGGPSKADLSVVDVGEGPTVVKDFANKTWWVRLLGRVQISREYHAYRWLEGMEGVPALVGRVDALAIAIEKVEGQRLAYAPETRDRGDEFVVKLRELIDRMHGRGLAHLDLRGRENLLLRPDGELVIVDLAGAQWLRPGSLAHRLFFPILAYPDETAFIKWKEMLTPGRLTEKEQALARRFDRLRPLWPFNKKKSKRRA